jgi:capsular polysaccharide biosynthesis protein
MQLRAYLRLLRDHIGLLVLGVVVAGGLAFLLTPRTPMYTARSTLYIGTRSIDLGANSRDLTYDRVAALDRLSHTFAAMIPSEPIAAQALDRAGLARSPASVVAATTATVGDQTNLLYVDVTDKSPVVAERLANGLSDSFVSSVQQFEPSAQAPAEGAVPALPVYTFERARLPSSPDPTALPVNITIAAILGLGLTASGILLADHLDVTVRGYADAERRLRLPVLGVMPRFSGDRVVISAGGPSEERQLRRVDV